MFVSDRECDRCNAAGYKQCWCSVSVAAPHEATTCKLCNSRKDMYAEIPENGDWGNRGFVMRIGCVCDKALNVPYKGWRTEFETYDIAINEWNDLNK